MASSMYARQERVERAMDLWKESKKTSDRRIGDKRKTATVEYTSHRSLRFATTSFWTDPLSFARPRNVPPVKGITGYYSENKDLIRSLV